MARHVTRQQAVRNARPQLESLEGRLLLSYTPSLWTAMTVDHSQAGAVEQTLVVKFASSAAGDALNKATFDWQDLLITGPDGFSRNAVFVSVKSKAASATGGTDYYATYKLTPPGGSWDVGDGSYADPGVYTVSLQANQVATPGGSFLAAGAVGDFTVIADVWITGDRGLSNGVHPNMASKLPDADGTIATLKIKGAATVLVTADYQLVIQHQAASTEQATLTITAKKSKLPGDNGLVDLVGIATDSPLKALLAAKTIVTGDITLGQANPGAIGKLQLHTLAAGTLTVANWTGAFTGLTLLANTLSDYSMDSIHPFTLISLSQWLDNGGDKDTLVAPFVQTLLVKGDLEANLELNGVGATSVTKLQVGGWFRDSHLHALGNLGVVTLGGIDTGGFYVGIDVGADFNTAAAGDFADTLRVTQLTIKGIRGSLDAVISSNFFAWSYGKVAMRDVWPDNGGTLFGLLGHSVDSYSHKQGGPVVFKNAGAIGPTVMDIQPSSNYIVRLV